MNIEILKWMLNFVATTYSYNIEAHSRFNTFPMPIEKLKKVVLKEVKSYGGGKKYQKEIIEEITELMTMIENGDLDYDEARKSSNLFDDSFDYVIETLEFLYNDGNVLVPSFIITELIEKLGVINCRTQKGY